MNKAKTFFFIATLLISIFTNAQKLKPDVFIIGAEPINQGFYLGFNHQINNYSIGIDLGTSLGVINPGSYYTFGIDNNFYFGTPNNRGEKTFHFSGNFLVSTIYDAGYNKPFRISLVPGVGNNFHVSDRVSLNFELGIQLPVYSTLIDENQYIYNNYSFSYIPTPVLRVEIRIK